jgi:hypothetical protein
MRPFIMVATILATAFLGSTAFAQHEHHNWCLQTGSSHECAFDTLAQCKAGKHGNEDRCVRNTPTMDH